MKTAKLEAWEKWLASLPKEEWILRIDEEVYQLMWQAFNAGHDAGKQFAREDAAERITRMLFTEGSS